jgi:hypothetical protein
MQAPSLFSLFVFFSLLFFLYSEAGTLADSCHRCRKYHSRNITTKTNPNPNTVVAATNAKR